MKAKEASIYCSRNAVWLINSQNVYHRLWLEEYECIRVEVCAMHFLDLSMVSPVRNLTQLQVKAVVPNQAIVQWSQLVLF